MGYENISMAETQLKDLNIAIGGKWRPQNCIPRSRIAILVPYRNRKAAVPIFLANLHPFLQRQNLEYTIFLVEQVNLLVCYCTYNKLFIVCNLVGVKHCVSSDKFDIDH